MYISIFVKHKLNVRALNQQFEWVNPARFWNDKLDTLANYIGLDVKIVNRGQIVFGKNVIIRPSIRSRTRMAGTL